MLKKIFRRVRKGIRDVGSFAKDHSGIANPELALLALTLGASGIMPGGKPFGLETLFGNLGKVGNVGRNLLGGFDKVITSPTANTVVQGDGILGTAQNILGGLGGIKDLLPFVNAFLAKKQYDQERKDILKEQAENKERYDFVTNKYGSPTGGSPFVDDRFEIYKPFQYDSEGRIIESAKGGIAQLNMGGDALKMGGTGGMGGMPFNPNNKISGMIPALAKGGESTGVPGLSADMSSNQMMNKIEDNPGITAFFPPKMGMISGPGGPKDDKIPAMLSDGEFVFTAKAVDNAGGPKAMYNMMNKLDPESSKGRGIV
mgnify:FL=1|jgi:hypothetical protein